MSNNNYQSTDPIEDNYGGFDRIIRSGRLIRMACMLALCAHVSVVSANDTYTFRIQQDCSTYWTIHGLWPNWQMFCTAPAFNVSLLAPIEPVLDRFWKSCFGHTNEWLWEHEWTKHGSCSGMDQLTYFSTAINLLGNYSSGCHLGDGKVLSDSYDGGSDDDNDCSLCFDKNLQPCLLYTSRCV